MFTTMFWIVVAFVAVDATCYYFCPEEYRANNWTVFVPGSGMYGLIKSKLNRE